MINRRLAHYEIVAKLGEGGMGVVWKARDTRLDRFAALKVLAAETASDSERRRRFAQEARAASALNHPGIVTIYDIAEADSTVYIAMEYVDGRTLADLIGAHGIGVKAALNYAIQAAQALAKAHAAGIVHRDLKPSNIMVTGDGLVKIVDFGIAKLARSSGGASIDSPDGGSAATAASALHTREGVIVGTAAYMSPEQAEGRKVDARSDIFSFGAVLYEMVTGVRAFQGASKMSTLAAVLNIEPTPPSEILGDVPRALERIILRCLQKDPARRIQVMADLVVELQEIKADSASGIIAVPGTRLPSRVRRRQLLASAVAISLLGAASWLVWYLRLPPPPAATVLPLTTSPGDERLPAFSPDGQQVAFVWNGEKRDNTDIYIKPVGGGTPLRLTTDPGEDTAPAWSPDASQIAFVRRNGRQATIYLTPPVPGSERKLADFRSANTTNTTIVGQMLSMSWFPDGAWLAVPAQDVDNTYGIVAIPISGGEPRRLSSSATERHQFPAVSPDGTVLAYAACVIDSVCDIYVLSLGPRLETRGPPRRLTQQRAGIQGVAWAADGRSLIYSSRLDGQHLWRVALSGAEPARLEIAGMAAVYPAVARAGDKLAFIRQGSGDSDLWKFEDGAPPESILSSTLSDYAPQWSPDGTRIAFVSDRSGRGPQIWVANKDGTNLTPVTDSTGRSQGTPRWSPDGRWIAYDAQGDEGTTHIYVIEADGGRPRRLTTDTGTEQFPSWSRDGKWVYYRSSMGDWRIWRTPIGGGPPQPMTDTGGRSAWESWDGRTLFYVREGALWAKPLEGGSVTRLLPAVHQWDFFPVEGGIYYVLQPDPSRRYAFELRYLDLADGHTRLLSKFESQEGNGLSVSPDGKTVLYSGVRMSAGDDLMVILNFR